MQRFPSLRGLCLLVLLSQSVLSAKTQLVGNDFNGMIYDVNPQTGAVTNPRPTGLTHLIGVTYRPDGTLFGLTAFNFAGANSNSLFRIDPQTGTPTLIGTASLFITEGDFDFDPLSGVLYGVQDLTRSDPKTLFTINTETGDATLIGGIDATADLSALAFDANANLFVLDTFHDRLLKVDKTNAEIIESVPLSLNLGSTAGMDFDPISGMLYVADGGVGGSDTLYTLDPSTGVLTALGTTTASGLAGLSFAPFSVPQPVSVSLLLAVMSGGIVLFLMCRSARNETFAGRHLPRIFRVLGALLFLALFLPSRSAHAAVFAFDWAGVNGYSAQGIFTFPDNPTLTTFTEQGLGATDVLDSLTISFFEPDNVLFALYAPVVNGQSVYEDLDFSFDLQNQEFFDAFDVGKYDGLEGDTFLISANSNLMVLGQIDAFGDGQLVDFSFNGIGVQAVPEPGTIALLVGSAMAGAMYFITRRRNSERYYSYHAKG